MAIPVVKKRRGEPLVARILETTLNEIARVGLESLSIEEVARRAGVNKTTIYRRWPTPEALSISAIERSCDNGNISDTGSLRGDLIDYLRQYRDVCRSPAMLSLARMHISGATNSKFAALIKERFQKADNDTLEMFQRAVERGELSTDTDIKLVRNVVLGSALNVILFRDEECTDEKLERVVDVILLGAARGGRADGSSEMPKLTAATRQTPKRTIHALSSRRSRK